MTEGAFELLQELVAALAELDALLAPSESDPELMAATLTACATIVRAALAKARA